MARLKPTAPPVWSILVATIPGRMTTVFPRLMADVLAQVAPYGDDVEVLWLGDNQRWTVGEKRQALLEMARGRFLNFLDDDDRIAPDFVATILPILQEKPDTDVVVYEQLADVNGVAVHCFYGAEFEYRDEGPLWFGKPAHNMVWRAAVAKQARFSAKDFGEDTEWVVEACKFANSAKQVRIDKVLYYYLFDSRHSETRG